MKAKVIEYGQQKKKRVRSSLGVDPTGVYKVAGNELQTWKDVCKTDQQTALSETQRENKKFIHCVLFMKKQSP